MVVPPQAKVGGGPTAWRVVGLCVHGGGCGGWGGGQQGGWHHYTLLGGRGCSTTADAMAAL